MSDLAASINKIQTEETSFRGPVSESLLQKIGSSINGLINMGPLTISGSSGSFTSSAAGLTVVTGLTTPFTTVGRQIFIMVIADTSGVGAYVSANDATFGLYRTGHLSPLGVYRYADNIGGTILNNPFMLFWDGPLAAGTYTYTLKTVPNSNPVAVQDCFLVAFEV